MPWELAIWIISVMLLLALMSQWWWQPRLEARLPGLRRQARRGPWLWYLLGYPVTVCRMLFTWRRLCQTADLSVVRRPRYAMVGKDSMVRAVALRPAAPRLGLPVVNPSGLTVRVGLHPGQTPRQFIVQAEAFAHAWRVHSVRVASVRRGQVQITAIARDPLEDSGSWQRVPAPRLMAAVVGRTEGGPAWTIDLRAVPHWLVSGSTQSGKSTLLASLVTELGAQPVALVGIDCKGGLELSLFSRRLSALATSRTEALAVLQALVDEMHKRMAACRSAGVRSVWDLDDGPVPIVVVVDEVAELYLTDGTVSGRKEVEQCSVLLLRLAQLGAALGVHVIVAAQRLGSDLGRGATALRAQLGGRVCHRVHDEETAEMTLGDLSPDAVEVAQAITEDERGVAVTTVGGHWMRARSTLVTPDEARRYADHNAGRTPRLLCLNHLAGSAGVDAA